MWRAVLLIAFNALQDPVRIGIVVLLISRPRPMPNLLAYWLGLMAMGFGAALAALFLLRDFVAPIMRAVTSVATNPVVPPIQIALGVAAVSTAALLAAPSPVRQAAYALVPGRDPSLKAQQPKTPSMFSRLSCRRLLEDGSPRLAFIAGLGTPPVEFWAAIMVILASGAGAGAQVLAALMFILVAYAMAAIPLVCYLASPAKTEAVGMRLHDWLCAHRRTILAFILGAVGVWMVLNGVGKF